MKIFSVVFPVNLLTADPVKPTTFNRIVGKKINPINDKATTQNFPIKSKYPTIVLIEILLPNNGSVELRFAYFATVCSVGNIVPDSPLFALVNF
jgi:hypothetical protein